MSHVNKCPLADALWSSGLRHQTLSTTHRSVAGSSPAAASMAVNSSEVELRHIEVVNGWYTVRVLLHVT